MDSFTTLSAVAAPLSTAGGDDEGETLLQPAAKASKATAMVLVNWCIKAIGQAVPASADVGRSCFFCRPRLCSRQDAGPPMSYSVAHAAV